MNQYVLKQPMQPTCLGVDDRGELIWGFRPLARWHQAMFPVRYEGDFLPQWMTVALREQFGENLYEHFSTPQGSVK